MNKMASRPSVPKVVARLVPFGAVAVANCINLVSVTLTVSHKL